MNWVPPTGPQPTQPVDFSETERRILERLPTEKRDEVVKNIHEYIYSVGRDFLPNEVKEHTK